MGGTTAQDIPEMVKIPGGTFIMGDERGIGEPDEKPTRKITIRSFNISRTEITVAQWKVFCKETNRNMPLTPEWGWNDDHPIVSVTALEADDYCVWLSKKTGKNFRLPTEAEWEFAARGGMKSKGYIFSGSNDLDQVGWSVSNSEGSTHPVAQKVPNELGLYDMSGNAWEWCSDWLDLYDTLQVDNPQGPKEGTFRVRRGGSWDAKEKNCRNTYRLSNSPRRSFHSIGVRVASSN